MNEKERQEFWRRVSLESSEFGVKESWAYALLQTAKQEELHNWMSLVKYPTIDIWICINLFLRRFYPEAPEIEISPDPDLHVMNETIAPVLKWYQDFKNKSIYTKI